VAWPRVAWQACPVIQALKVIEPPLGRAGVLSETNLRDVLCRPYGTFSYSVVLTQRSRAGLKYFAPTELELEGRSRPHATIAGTMADWARPLELSREALINSARTAVATVASLLLARSLKLPEFYWAPISTVVILLSIINPLTLAWQRFAGTALGAALGALIATFFSSNWIVYGAGIFVCGIVCSLLRVNSAYRFAAITLSIVLLIAHERPPWIVASHRFVEVSLGIAVALLTAEVWRMPGVKAGSRGGMVRQPDVSSPRKLPAQAELRRATVQIHAGEAPHSFPIRAGGPSSTLFVNAWG